MKVYIAMPINGADYNHERMFRAVGEIVREFGLEPVLPSDDVDPQVWQSWLQEKPFAECCMWLVECDLGNLTKADAILAIMPNPSIGTAMEICYARLWAKRVVVVTTQKTFYHPWLWYHAHKVIWSEDPFGDGVRRACKYLLESAN